MANYKRGPWDEQLDGLMDITACCGVAHEELEAIDLRDHEMDRHQEAGYRYLRSIHREPDSPDVKRWAEAALNHFAEAERLEMLIESHVHNGDGQVQRYRDRSLELTPAADEQPRSAANPGKLTLSISEAAQVLGVGTGMLREKLKTGEVPGLVRMGRRHLVSHTVLKEWMGGNHGNGGDANGAGWAPEGLQVS